MNQVGWVLLFIFVQLLNIPLMVLGWFICLDPLIADCLWLWWNSDDPPYQAWSWWETYVWLAWRNPVANLRHVKFVSGKNRPLFYRTWVWFKKEFYVKAGWMSDGYPALSAGAGRGY